MNPTIFVVNSTCGYGDDHYSVIVYVGMDEVKARSIASTGGIFMSESNKWNTLEVWRDEKMVRAESFEGK